jgi:phosphoglycolate phosphatase-like HAD superfamily hydrolase
MRDGPVGFDLDMTLIDSRPGILAAWTAFSRETGIPVDVDDINTRGFAIKLEDEMLHWVDAADVDKSAAIFLRHYVTSATEGTRPFAGASDALASVEEAGETTLIVTAKHEASARVCLEVTGLRAQQLFHFVQGPEKATVLRQMGAAAYVGDTPADMAAAKNADAVAIGVTTGAFNESQLREAGADHVLDSLTEFRSLYYS